MSQGLLNNLANPTNHVAEAYQARTKQFDDQQRQKDNDMLKVFEFAGDGHIEEARYYAQNKGLEVPQEIYSNADFAKGLTLAGKIYGDDPVAAQKFTTAWIQNPQGDFQSRLAAAQQAAGKVIDPLDREFQRKIRLEQWKIDHKGREPYTLSPGETRYEGGKAVASTPAKPPIDRFKAGADAYNASVQSGLSTPQQAEAARQSAYQEWDAIYGQNPAGAASQGLVGGQAPASAQVPAQGTFSPAPAPLAQPAPASSYTQPQIPSGLPPGSVMIGTSNGKAVYQAPNGDRFIDDGNP